MEVPVSTSTLTKPDLSYCTLCDQCGGTAGKGGYEWMEIHPDGDYVLPVAFANDPGVVWGDRQIWAALKKEPDPKMVYAEFEAWRDSRFVRATYRGAFDRPPASKEERQDMLRSFLHVAWPQFRMYAAMSFALMELPTPWPPVKASINEATVEKMIERGLLAPEASSQQP